MSALVCPTCGVRWRIVVGTDDMQRACPLHAPAGDPPAPRVRGAGLPDLQPQIAHARRRTATEQTGSA
jgi:hypothetical protein